MNKLLQRQIEKFLGKPQTLPQGLEPLLTAISKAYDGFEADQTLIERSLDISSAELTTINDKLRDEIRDRQTAENELRHTVSLLTATLESTADGILVVDEKGTIKDYNKRFAAMWQIPDTVTESHDDDRTLASVLGQLNDPNGFLAKVRELYDTPTNESFDVIHFRDGRACERYSKPQLIDNEIVGRVWSFRDITQRVRADQEQVRLVAELENSNRDLANVNQELNDFAYVVSHDLKAPLRGIRALADWISTDYADKLDSEGQEQLRLLTNRVDRMHDLIEGILQYSRIGRIRDEIVPIDLRTLLPNIIDMLAPPEHITIAVQEELPIIHGEHTKTLQVFQNLLSNAIKYMDKTEGHIAVHCTEADEFWRFSITDNGPGIEEKHFQTIFQMFRMLSPRDGFESTGVGLTIVKKIVEIHGGTVWVESKPGQGSTFLFTMPKMQKEKTNAQLQTSPAC
jgi:signal transduction histidine kinase